MRRRSNGSGFGIVPLTPQHNRAVFDCGVASLNEFLHRYARQNENKGLSRTFAASPAGDATCIAGYYTLSSGALKAEQMPPEKLPRYPVPVAHLGRLAVDRNWQGRGLGERLLLDALRRCAEVADEIGIYAVEVVALNEAARHFYERYGFAGLSDNPQHLYLAMKVIKSLKLGEAE